MLSGISLAVAVIIKDELKYAFGRTGPGDDVFGFFPFHGGPGYASFPSGHATAICAVITVFWICYPRFRPLYALCVAAVTVGLVGENFHFLSDVIAGGFLGISAGWLGVALWERGQAYVIDAQGRLFGHSDAGLVASHPDMTRLVQVEAARAGGGPVPGEDILGRDVLTA
jgi:membrane-associated phospholipid phosphatase